MNNIGFIGLGNMGLGMANNILEKNKELNVYSRTKSKIDLLKDGNIIEHSSIKSIASSCDILFTCLPDIKTSLDVGIFNYNDIHDTDLVILGGTSLGREHCSKLIKTAYDKGLKF